MIFVEQSVTANMHLLTAAVALWGENAVVLINGVMYTFSLPW